MVTVKVLKRRDAASVAVAIVVGLIVYSFLSAVTNQLASNISGRVPQVTGDWQTLYLYPLVLAALQLIALEILLWLYAWSGSMMKK